MRSIAIFGLVAAAMVTTACAGPHAPFGVGTQNAPVNLVLGERQAVTTAPVGPIGGPLPPGVPPAVPPGPSVSPSPTASPSGPCPAFDPLAPVLATDIELPGPPRPATYTYRGKVVDTAGKDKSTYRGNSKWKVIVGKADPTTHGYDVTLKVKLGKTTSSRVLLIQPKPLLDNDRGTGLNSPTGTDPNSVLSTVTGTLLILGVPPLPLTLPNVGRFGPAGIYLVSQSNGDTTFKPTVPIPLLQTPVGNNSFTGIGTDGSTVMAFTSTVTKRLSVNACGTKVEGIDVALTSGNIASLGADGKAQLVTFTEHLVFGMQFGGIPLQDKGTITTSTLPGAAIVPDKASRQFSFTVNAVPKQART
ncbi:MAG TPA: hypothetical protein VHD81_09655 [Mycobacteriales bacterium]|nr:hypothetical protein [Mycobacteriales bacterium]